MENTLMVFTMKGCPYCDQLKNRLNELNIPFTEYITREHRYIWEQVVKQTGLRHLPTVFIKEGETNTGPVFISGRDFSNTEQAIEKIRKYI